MTHEDQPTVKDDRIVTEEMLADLPEPVQRYMAYTGVVGKPWIHNVVLKQTGRFRQGINRPWMPMTAVQRYTTAPPSFVWEARFKIAGMSLLRARDEYRAGHGHMFGKLAGLITLFDVRGDELDQGAMLRYLSEMIWFPIAFLGPAITWLAVDDESAGITFEDAGKSVTGRLYFDDQGRPVNFTAMRYRDLGQDEFSRDPWSTPITDYAVRAGLNLPVRGQAVWNLPSGDLPYVDVEIDEVEYNVEDHDAN